LVQPSSGRSQKHRGDMARN